MTYLEGQIIHRQAIITLWHARIVSGTYASRKVFHGTQGREFTNAELLQDSLECMERNVDILQELTEHLSVDNKAEKKP